MPHDYLSTSELARRARVHPNTVRLYETWGYLSPVPRAANGYRHFSQAHLNQVLLVRALAACTWLQGGVRETAYQMIFTAARENWIEAFALSNQLVIMVQSERAQAEAAAVFLDEWARGRQPEPLAAPLRIGEAARLLHTTIDALRNWERNGLIRVPRDPRNGYRCFGAGEVGRLRIIRMLLKARYSLMAVLRMLTRLDGGITDNLRGALDTPRPDENVFYFTDRWLSTLAEMEQRVNEIHAMLHEIVAQSAQSQDSRRP